MLELTVEQLAGQLLAVDKNTTLIDVREHWEIKLCALHPHSHIPMQDIPAAVSSVELIPDHGYVILCHHGIRSELVCRYLDQQGFKSIYNVVGGIDAWARQIDTSMTTY